MKNKIMNSPNKIKLLLIILPVVINIFAVILISDIIFSHKVDLNFNYSDGKIGGSRWFSYKYLSEKYFHENRTSLSNRFLSKNDALQQVPEISKVRAYSGENIKLLYHIIDSLSENPDNSINNEKSIDIIKLDIALDDINQ
jgi:K+-transporting ATPase c subunit